MKKYFVFLCFVLCASSTSLFGQIVANHTIVDQCDNIPQRYIDSVKTMWLVIAGESHSAAYRDGLNRLENSNPMYAVSIAESGTPQVYTNVNLRASRGTWGDLSNETGWRYGYGEEDWFTSATALTRTKAGITYCNTNNLTIGAIGLGWCWDPGINDFAEFSDYIQATRSYIEYCADSINTKIIFTTGTVDDYTGETGYLKHLGYETIRDSVGSHSDWILFDYADILCYDDNGDDSIVTWDGHQYPVIASNNLLGGGTGHIGMNGAVRLAKALWWMLARIKGWDGIGTGLPSDNTSGILPGQYSLSQNYPNPFNPITEIKYHIPAAGYVSLKIYDNLGREVKTLVNEVKSGGIHSVPWNGTNAAGQHLGSGVYFCRMEAPQAFHGRSGSFMDTKKLLLLK